MKKSKAGAACAATAIAPACAAGLPLDPRPDGRHEIFERAFDCALAGVAIITPQSRLLYANPAICAMLGYDAAQLQRLRDRDIVHADDIAASRAAFRRLLAGEVTQQSAEIRFLCKDGRVIWAASDLSLIRDETSGALLGVMAQVRNIDAEKEKEFALARSLRFIRSVGDYSPIGFVRTAADGSIQTANPAFAAMVGYDGADLLGMNLLQFFDAGERGDLTLQMDRVLSGAAGTLRSRLGIRGKNGAIVRALLVASVVTGIDGQSTVLLWQIIDAGVTEDATARIRQLEELHEAKELAQVTIASVAEGLIRTDIEGRITLCNAAAAQLLGVASRDIQGRLFSELVGFVDHRNGRKLPDPVTAVLRQGRPVKLGPYAGLKRSDGRVRPIIDSTAPLRGLDGRMIGAVVVIQDATETFVLTERLAAQAYRDDLTRLPNRRAFEDHIAERLRSKRSSQLQDFLLFVDLDHFKVVNDTCGHAVGDELLHEAAHILRAQARESDFVARLGGDEFGVVLHATTERVASKTAERVLAALGKHRFTRGGRSFEIGASIGMTTLDACNGGASAVMTEADTACYAAKNLGRGRFHVFRRDDATIADARRSMGWLHRIQEVFESGGFRLFVQKIIDTKGATCGYEALIRLVEDDGFICSPEAFLPAAKRFGLMARIDRVVFQKIFELIDGGEILGQSIGGKYVSANMSAASLADPMFRAWLNGMLQRMPHIASSLWIEITETDEMHWDPAELEFLAKIRDMGVRVYLDDFGTGYNSFDVLKRIGVDGIKIDRSVVRDIACDPIDQALVIAAISIVADLGIELVAEGVEDEATLEFLSHHGIKKFQGFLFHRPEEADVRRVPAAVYRSEDAREAAAGLQSTLMLN